MKLDLLVDGFSQRFGGGVSYLSGLLPPLARHPAVGRLRLVVEPGAALNHKLAGSGVEIEPVRLRPSEGLSSRAAWEAVVLPRRAAGSVVIAPAAMLPRKLHAPVVAVPHNALPFQLGGLRHTIQRRAIVRTLGWASGAIFVTDHMRRLVSGCCELPRATEVVHHGLADVFHSPYPEGPRAGIVCVADAYPHKRLDLLVEAWRGLGAGRPTLRLIGRQMAGAPTPEPGLTVDSELSSAQVAAALRGAQLAVLPSVSESFGIPALEAMACGTPLLASDIPAVREVTGGHALLVTETRAAGWAGALRKALEAPPPVEPGRTWARTFTWARCAAATVAVVEEAVSSHGRALRRDGVQ